MNPVSQEAVIVYDSGTTSVSELGRHVAECGFHCSGRVVPDHVCDPWEEPLPSVPTAGSSEPASMAAHPAVPDHGAPAVHGGAVSGLRRMSRSAPAEHERGAHRGHDMAGMVAAMRNRFLLAATLSVPVLLWSPIGREVLGFTTPAPFGWRDDVFALLLSLPVIGYSAGIFFTGAWRALRAGTLDMMVLVAVAVGAGWGYSLGVTLTGGGEVFYEAATVLTAFVLLGHWFEMRARGGANDAIRSLLELAPARATVLRDGAPVEVATAEVVVGDVMLVRPGGKFATDGVVLEGQSDVDESMVTGESLPVAKSVGSDVIGGSVNSSGTLRVRAVKVGAETALAQIVALVQQAQNSKAPGQRLADRAAFWLVFVALIGGSLTFTVWLASGASVQTALLFAITVVVITCPDALGLATPTAIMVGAGLGARRGILFKNAAALEAAAAIDTVVLDKTGTLTKGTPTVRAVWPVPGAPWSELEVLGYAASLEEESEHPLARAVVTHARQAGAPSYPVQGFRNVAGLGATARVDGHRVAVGKVDLLGSLGVSTAPVEAVLREAAGSGRTAVLVSIGQQAVAVIALADAPRPTAAAAVAALHELGVSVVMLTGDNEATARRIAGQLGIDDVVADVLPADKAAKVLALQQQGRKVAMVGDGVNDAPALAQAEIGVAIGAGADVAIETADVVLMRSDPLDVATALRIGRGTVRKMRQNLAWAVGYNAVALPVAAGVFEPAFGLMLRPEIAALSMSGSSLLVALNALLLKRLRLAARPEAAAR